jgi:hypothetical protein
VGGVLNPVEFGKDYERLCTTGEAFVYAAMTRLMVRRLARAKEFPDSLLETVRKDPTGPE